MHEAAHPLAGKTVTIKGGVIDPIQGQVVTGAEYRLEDWWDRLTGKSWTDSDGNPAALHYAVRSTTQEPWLPLDDEVVYGKIRNGAASFGHIVHISEIEEI